MIISISTHLQLQSAVPGAITFLTSACEGGSEGIILLTQDEEVEAERGQVTRDTSSDLVRRPSTTTPAVRCPLSTLEGHSVIPVKLNEKSKNSRSDDFTWHNKTGAKPLLPDYL